MPYISAPSTAFHFKTIVDELVAIAVGASGTEGITGVSNVVAQAGSEYSD